MPRVPCGVAWPQETRETERWPQGTRGIHFTVRSVGNTPCFLSINSVDNPFLIRNAGSRPSATIRAIP